MDRKELSVRVSKLALDVVTANWTAAAQSGIELAADLSTSTDRVAKRAARAATEALDGWARTERVPEDDFSNGVDLAIAAASAPPHELAELVALHFPDVRALSDAMLGRENVGSPTRAVAAHVLDVVLTALLDEPDFRDQLDRAIAYGVYREILGAKDDKRRRRHEDDEQLARETRRAITRHTDARVESLLSRHRDREFEAVLLAWLRGQVQPPEQWRVDVTRNLEELATSAARAGRADASIRLRALPLDGSFDAVRATLRRSARLISECSEGLEDERERKAAHRAVTWLTMQTRSPGYRTSVLLTGRWGAGKSRVLGELASRLTEETAPDVVVLRLLPETGMSFTDALLREATQALRRTVGTVTELTTELRSSGAVGLVIVDDFDRFVLRRVDLENVVQTIADSTEADRLRWVLTVDSWRLDRVLSPADRWQEFSSGQRQPSATDMLAGWLDLDAHSVESRVGTRIVERELGADVDAGTLAREELLDFPLNAWLYVDVAQGLGVAADTFEESYWSTVFQGIAENTAELDACDRLRESLEEMFASNGRQPVSRAEVIERVTGGSASIGRDEVRSALELFGEARLLAFQRGGLIEMRSPALWAVGVGRNLAESFGTKFSPLVAAEATQTFLRRCEPDFAEAVLMHLVGALPWASPYVNRCRKLIGRLISSPEVDNAGIWAAALLLGDEIRRSLIRAVPGLAAATGGAGPNRGDHRRSAHEVYLLLRLCLQSDEDGWPFVERMAMLRDAYAVIGDNGLEPLMRSMIARRLQANDVGRAEDRSLLLHLAEGLERALSAREFARAWVKLTVAAIGPSEAVAAVTEFLRLADLDYAPDVPLGVDEGQRDERAPFPTHLGDALAAKTAENTDPLAAYETFRRARWLDRRAWPSRFGLALRSTCHVALGHQYLSDPDGVIELLKILLRGNVHEQESALFILRHTGGTSGRRGVRLDPDLVDLLLSLARNNTLSQRIRDEWLKPLIDANRR